MYTTVDRVKARMSELQNDTAMDDLLQNFIKAASAQIDGYCKRKFKRGSYTYEAFSRDAIYLSNAPVISIDNVERRASSSSAYEDISDYSFGTDGAFLTDCSSFFSQTIPDLRITYTGGYLIDFENVDNEEAHNLPADITEACELLVVRRFQRRNNEGMTQSDFETSEVHFDKVFDSEIKEMLAGYKVVVL